jgi:serine/threonine protein kinase
VKLLDFGLAKAAEQNSSASKPPSPTMSPTLSLAMTQAGMIFGTAAYMSPEQARGYSVDRRADIWAFGVILFRTAHWSPFIRRRRNADRHFGGSNPQGSRLLGAPARYAAAGTPAARTLPAQGSETAITRHWRSPCCASQGTDSRWRPAASCIARRSFRRTDVCS